jgi:hypothetical protein
MDAKVYIEKEREWTDQVAEIKEDLKALRQTYFEEALLKQVGVKIGDKVFIRKENGEYEKEGNVVCKGVISSKFWLLPSEAGTNVGVYVNLYKLKADKSASSRFGWYFIDIARLEKEGK